MTDWVRDSVFRNIENLTEAAKMPLRQQLSEKQLVIMCDVSEHAAGNVLLTKDYTDTAEGTQNFYAPVAFGSR